MLENNFSVWIGNGGSIKVPNRNVFTGTENECVNFINKIVKKKREKKIKIYYHIRTGMMIKSIFFYAFISENK